MVDWVEGGGTAEDLEVDQVGLEMETGSEGWVGWGVEG